MKIDTYNPTGDKATVPIGSTLDSKYVPVEVDGGWLITAGDCDEGHDGPYYWHHLLPLPMGGTTTTDNLVSMCMDCVHGVAWFINLFAEYGTDLTSGYPLARPLRFYCFTAREAFRRQAMLPANLTSYLDAG